MTQYVSMPKKRPQSRKQALHEELDYDSTDWSAGDRTLHVDSFEPQKTGLLDRNGNPLVRMPEKIGF